MKMKRPVIALTPEHDPSERRIFVKPEYCDAILDAGGIPIVLDQFNIPELYGDILPQLLDKFDGVLFTGGVDEWNPERYHEKVSENCGTLDGTRDEFESALYKLVYERNMPHFGICRGIQTMNVCCGGALFQDIPGHRNVNHKAYVEKDTLLYDIIGKEEIEVNSTHHQAVKVPAKNFNVAATSREEACGVITEAMWDKSRAFSLGVQWHPERLWRAHGDESSLKLFKAFVSACGEYHKNK